MAFEVLDEHEQGELVRKWLRENAMSIVVGIALGLALIFGWQQWKAHRGRHSLEAAQQFSALSDNFQTSSLDDANKVAETLRKDYSDTSYAVLAALRQADAAVGKGDTAAAAADLQWAVDHAGVPALKSLAQLRLGRLKIATGDTDGALKLFDQVKPGDYAGLVGELRGDALAKLGRKDEARKAYQDALTHLDPNAPNRSFVQMKLDDIAAPAPAAEKQGS